jgi:hypothetical protein
MAVISTRRCFNFPRRFKSAIACRRRLQCHWSGARRLGVSASVVSMILRGVETAYGGNYIIAQSVTQNAMHLRVSRFALRLCHLCCRY